MKRISTYLTFNGNCSEAMNFYQRCFGGTLSLQTVGESPGAEKLPKNIQAYILHATLRKGDFLLMGTDMIGDEGLIKGNSVSVFLECNNEQEMRMYYTKLLKGGRTVYPIETSYWGYLFGELADKFGNRWLLSYKNL